MIKFEKNQYNGFNLNTSLDFIEKKSENLQTIKKNMNKLTELYKNTNNTYNNKHIFSEEEKNNLKKKNLYGSEKKKIIL